MFHSPGVRVILLKGSRFLSFPRFGYHLSSVPQPDTDILLQRWIKFYVLNWSGKIRTCHSLPTEGLEGKFGKKEIKKKKSKGDKVSIINEYDTEVYMYLSEAEKYARRNNLTLIKLGGSPNEKTKYKFQQLSDICQSQATSKNESKAKVILIREGISKNDLLIKINQMLKNLKKEADVVCIVEAKESSRLKSISDEIITSELQPYFAQQIALRRGVKFYFKAGNVKADNTPEDESENVNVQNSEKGN